MWMWDFRAEAPRDVLWVSAWIGRWLGLYSYFSFSVAREHHEGLYVQDIQRGGFPGLAARFFVILRKCLVSR